jgi:hypothetical protein
MSETGAKGVKGETIQEHVPRVARFSRLFVE